MSDMRRAAVDLAARGFRVFPLQPGSKVPHGGVSWLDLICADEAQAWTLWERYAGSNVAVAAGKGLLIIDVDMVPGAAERYAALGLPQTFSVATPSGGFHFYFSTDSDVRNGRGKDEFSPLGQGIDWRGRNGYVVGPGSSLPNGEYRVTVDAPIAEAPAWLVERLGRAPEKSADRTPVADLSAFSGAIADACLRAIADAPRAGTGPDDPDFGNDKTFAMAARLHGLGAVGVELFSLLCIYNQMKCDPPWDEEALRTIATSAERNSRSRPGEENPTIQATAAFGDVYAPDAHPDQPDDEPFGEALDVDKIVAPPKPMDWLIPDFLPRREVTLFYGDGGVGKGTLGMQLTVAAQDGAEFCGMPVKRGRVLMVDFEDSLDRMHERYAKVRNAVMGFPGGVRLVSLAGEPGSYLIRYDEHDNPQPSIHWPRLQRMLRDYRPDLFILANLADVFVGNDISRIQARRFVGALRQLSEAFGMATLLLAHPSQAGMESGRQTSGSVAWRNSTRSMWTMRRDEDDEKRRILRMDKSNYGPAGMELELAQRPNGLFDVVASKAKIHAEKQAEVARLVREILAQESGSLPTIDVAKRIKHDDAALMLATEGNYGGVKRWLLSLLSRGYRYTDGKLLVLLGDTMTLE